MGLCNSPDIFQEKMNELFAGFDYVRAYIDDLLVITKGSFNDHLTHLDKVLEKLNNAGLKINATKCCFAAHELEYLGYWVSRNGIQPMATKVEAIKNMATPKTQKALRSFIGLVNYYCNMWRCRSELLAPLSKLTSEKNPFKWTEKHQKAFERIKLVLSKKTLLRYPNFSKKKITQKQAKNS